MGCWIDRLVDATGAATGDGLFTVRIGGGSCSVHYLTFSPATLPGTLSTMPANIAPWSEPYNEGGDVWLLPHRVSLHKEFPPLLGSLTYRHSDITELTPITINMYGSDHTFLPLGDVITAAWSGGIAATTGHSIAIRWE